MEDDTVDFNIQNYDLDDLEYFFKLDEIPNYGISDIEKQAADVQANLLNGGSFNPSLKQGFIDFIGQGKHKLLQQAKVNKKPDIYEEKILTETPILQENSHIVERPKDTSFKGSLNPLKIRKLTRILNIDTKFRDNLETNSADFIIQLPMKFYKVTSMKVSAIEIPIRFYGISEYLGNNYFTLVVDGGTPTVITIPDGNYYNAQLISTLNTTIHALGAPFDTVTFTLNSINDKVTVTTTSASIELYFDADQMGDCKIGPNTQLTNKFGYNLGFTKASYTGGVTYTGESLINPRPHKYMFLSVDDFQNNVSNNSFVSAFQNSFLDNNILARISTNLFRDGVIINDDELLSEPRQYFGPVDIQKLRIRLYDEYGRIIDMNGVNYAFCLTMEHEYKM
tara:strand:+ start:3453 stop:4634 length:1182 start_codon:yes stop_codon:yes gene_type:complete